MRFQIDGKEVYVHFQHMENEPEEGFICTEVNIESEHLAEFGGHIFGRAFCHPNDQFCKRTGRKIALERALYVEDEKQERLISRDFTGKFWNEYFKGIPGDKVNQRQRWVQLPSGEFVKMSEVVAALGVARSIRHAGIDIGKQGLNLGMVMGNLAKWDPAQGNPAEVSERHNDPCM